MIVTPTTMTLAEFCQQYESGAIAVDRSYQRSPNWPTAARSFLIDTILEGYPIPKLSLAQSTDLKTRKTLKEVIDGQQRTTAILQFYTNKLRISTRNSKFSGKLFDQLEDEDKERFLSYPLSLDIFTGATPQNLRELFRRINWYTAPLNHQEKRHAQFAGEFKLFVSNLAGIAGQWFLDNGTFGSSQISRMSDAALIAECMYTYLYGISHASEAKLFKMYETFDSSFPTVTQCYNSFLGAVSILSNIECLFNTHLSKSYNVYSLLTATMYSLDPIHPILEVEQMPLLSFDEINDNLLKLNDALENKIENSVFEPFVAACSKATNREKQRAIRFCYFYTAVTSGNFEIARKDSLEMD